MENREDQEFLRKKEQEGKKEIEQELDKAAVPEDIKEKLKSLVERAYEGKPALPTQIHSQGRKKGRVENVPPIFKENTEDDPTAVPEQVDNKVAKYTAVLTRWIDYDEPLPGLLFYGDFGVGKTSMAIELMRYAAKTWKCNCRYEKVQTVLAKVKETYDGNGLRERDVVDYYKRFDILTIDEIGAQYASEAERNILYWIVVSRYELMRPTFFTTNYDPTSAEGREALYACLGERICDRFKAHLVDSGAWGGNLRK